MATRLHQLGQALELPTAGSPEELMQLIEGKVADRDDQSIQVMIEETLQVKTVIWLVDSEGPVL